MNTNNFERWNLAWGSSWAYKLFQQHHRQINSLYWSHIGVKNSAFQSTRKYTEEDPTSVLFQLSDPANKNLDIPLGEWSKNYSDFDNWVRLNALVGITGYLEVFFKTIIRAAIESDPSVLHGASRVVDGVVYLKSNPKYSLKEHADNVSIGDWNQRIAKYKKIFGSVPCVMEASVRELEDLRRTRNGVSHTFGRSSDDYDSIVDANAKPQKKISEEKLVKTLALIGKIAKEVEVDLASKHIGDFESVYFYHQWDKVIDPNHQTEPKVLKKKIGQLHGRSIGKEYFQELISYYNSL